MASPDRGDGAARRAGRRGRIPLVRALSRLGFATRTGALRLLDEGRVTVDGVVARDAALRVDPAVADVRVDGRRPAPRGDGPVVIVLNKPRGPLVTREDPQGRATVFDLLPADRGLLRCVGRLDGASAGLLLATDDPLLASRLEDPARALDRVYRVKVRPRCEGDRERRFREGAVVDGVAVRPAAVEVESHGPRSSWLRVTVREGRNREIRRMASGAGLEVEHLIRIAYGPVELGNLAPGAWREAQGPEREALLRAAGPGRGRGSDRPVPPPPRAVR